jgi:hypothetical protein
LVAEAGLLGLLPEGLPLGVDGEREVLVSLAAEPRGDLALAPAGLLPDAGGGGVLRLAGEAAAALEAAGDLLLPAGLAAAAAAGDLAALTSLGAAGDAAAGLGSGVVASLRTALLVVLPGVLLRLGLEAGVAPSAAGVAAAAELAGALLAEMPLMRRLSPLSVSLRSCSAEGALPGVAACWLPWLAAGVTSTALILRLRALSEPARAASGLAVVALRRRGGVSGPDEGLRAAGEAAPPRCSGRM